MMKNGIVSKFWLTEKTGPPPDRPWRIVLLKVAYNATSSARSIAKLCQNYARIPKLCSPFPKLWSQNDVDSVHISVFHVTSEKNYNKKF